MHTVIKSKENNELVPQTVARPLLVTQRLIHTREIGMFGPNLSEVDDTCCPCLSKQNLHPDPSPWRRGDAI